MKVRFKAPWQRKLYGDTAQITNVQTIVDRHHAGHVVCELVGLVTDNGTRLQWARSQVSHDTKPVLGA